MSSKWRRGELLDLAKTVNFESMHVLTARRCPLRHRSRVFVETPWTFESNGRSMVRKVALPRSDTGCSYEHCMAAVLFHRSSV